jgi:hypothetical protein
VIVTDSLAVDGGSAKVALSSAMALADSGLQVTVFAAAGVASKELMAHENIRIVCTHQGDALASANKLGGALRGLWNRTARKSMADLLSTLEPENTVVHVHGWTKALSSSRLPDRLPLSSSRSEGLYAYADVSSMYTEGL